jgi:hypothetical protein
MFLTLNLLLIPRYTMLISPVNFLINLQQYTTRSATNIFVVSVHTLIPQIDNLYIFYRLCISIYNLVSFYAFIIGWLLPSLPPMLNSIWFSL